MENNTSTNHEKGNDANRVLAAVVRQCKDVPDKPILEFLYERRKEGKVCCCLYDGFENSIGQSMPSNTPEKIIIQKMAKLIKRGLVSGCGCGCRGDYEITKKGIEWLLYNGKYSDKYVSWLENEVLALRQPLVSGSSLPRLFVAENQEFVIEGQIFTWYFSNKELRQGIVLNRKGMIEPSKFTVTVAKK